MALPQRIPTGPGQENVWDYPRPPKLEPLRRRIRVMLAGEAIVDTLDALRVLETGHAPGYYVPLEAVRKETLEPSARRSLCDWKGTARYYSLRVGDVVAADAAWTFDKPNEGYEALTGWVSFYPRSVDEAWVDGRRALAQPGAVFGGWVTSDIVGPFVGEPGAEQWL